MTQENGLPQVGPWAREKLERLQKYLSAYSTILSRRFKGYVYVKSGRIAVKVINHLGDEVMKVFRIQ